MKFGSRQTHTITLEFLIEGRARVTLEARCVAGGHLQYRWMSGFNELAQAEEMLELAAEILQSMPTRGTLNDAWLAASDFVRAQTAMEVANA
jgi:hypothetical protein